MKTLNSVIIHKPSFAKTAGVKLPKNAMDWNELIIKQFYSELSFIPKEYNVDAVVNNVDDKAGYAKGSVVVWDGNNKINFPVIIKDWELSPFDTFTQNDGEDDYYRSATEANVKSAMSDQNLGEPADVPGIYPTTDDVKRPGDIVPKTAVMTQPRQNDGTMTFDKVAFDWKSTVNKDDFEKFAEELQVSPGIRYSFHENNPDLLGTIIDEITSKRIVPKTSARGIYDVRHFIKRKQMDTITDDQMFDVNMLKPMEPGQIVNLRINMVPTLEDVMTSGNTQEGRLAVAANGLPVQGIILEDIDPFDNDKSHRHIFLSHNGKAYAKKYVYKKNEGFYGIAKSNGDTDHCINHLRKCTSDNMLSLDLYGADNTKGLDKTFAPSSDSIDYYKRKDTRIETLAKSPEIAVVYRVGDSYKAFTQSGPFKKITVEGNEVYIGDRCAIVKANVAAPVIAKTTKDPVYRAAIGNVKMILIPEAALVINLGLMNNISNVLMEPTREVKNGFDGSPLSKVAVQIGSKGFRVTGSPVDPLKKLASIDAFNEFSAKEAETVLYTLGMSKEAANNALQGLVKKASLGYGDTINVYGVNSDYVDLSPKHNMEKQAKLKTILKEYADSIKVNLIKEASVVEDPEAVDNILSLNFINDDNILEYANYVQELRETSDKLSELLIANRMGLKDVDEASTKKAVDGLEEVIKGLSKLKMVTEG